VRILRQWLEQQVLPAFGEGMFPVDTAIARDPGSGRQQGRALGAENLG
jgi:hypothetical protein